MTTDEDVRSTPGQRNRRGLAVGLLAAALGFVLIYLSVDFIAPKFADSSLPLPNAPAAEAKAWYAANPTSAVLTGILQLLSVSCLAAFATLLTRTARSAHEVRALTTARAWGLAAVGCMLVSSVLSWLLAATADSASVGTVGALRTANFIAGGTAHVVALGLFVAVAAKGAGVGRKLRIFSLVAAVPAVASLVSLAVFEGAVLILLGRLLCMIWTIAAAVSLGRRLRAGSTGRTGAGTASSA